jgi:hypothetical protein
MIDGVFLQYYLRLINIAVWAVLNYCLPRYAPMCAILCQFSYGMYWYLNIEEYLEEAPTSRDVEVGILQLIIILTGANYNSFKINVLLMTPAILVPYFLVLHKAGQINDTDSDVVIGRMFFMSMLVIIIQIGQYLKQRDMAKIVIRTHMQE